MLLKNVHIIGATGLQHIQISAGKIKAISGDEIRSDEPGLSFDNALAFPGLINSHDHLDFNSFPRTGNHVYKNYTEWGKDIRENNQEAINAVLKIPRPLRTQWGIYKNLLNGVTTVVNHGEHLIINDSPITVFQDCYSLHSIHFENNWKYQLNSLFKKKGSYVIHIGEGTDAASGKEITTLTKWNLFKRKLIGIHGVAMNESQATRFHAVVWCPASNFFLLNCTAPVDQLKKHTNIIFGTDSTLTAEWNIWEQLRQARGTKLLTDDELLDAVGSTAASVWDMNNGTLASGKDADIVVAKIKDHVTDVDAFYALNPEDILMVMHQGEICLFDESLNDQLKILTDVGNDYSRISIGGQFKYIKGDLPALMSKIEKYNEAISFPVSRAQ